MTVLSYRRTSVLQATCPGLLAALVIFCGCGREQPVGQKPALPPPAQDTQTVSSTAAVETGKSAVVSVATGGAARTASATNPAAAPATEVSPGGWKKPAPVPLERSFEIFTKLCPGAALRVPSVSNAPVVDGVLDDVYKAATPVKLVFLDGNPGRARLPTEVRVVSTEKDLFVFYRCSITNKSAIKAEGKTHDGTIWEDDSVDIFLNPVPWDWLEVNAYYQITINSLGTTAESRYGPETGGRGDPSWNPKLVVATKIEDKEWTVEVAIPFADLCGSNNPVPRVWAANFNRMARLEEDDSEDTAWSPSGSTSSHAPDTFGRLWLDGGTVYPVDYARWTGPRHIFRASERPIFSFKPANVELLLQCQEVTPNADGAYWFGKLKSSANNDTLLIVRDDEGIEVSSLHGWRAIFAKWVTPKIICISRSPSEHEEYYCLYDVDARKVILEETGKDGTEIWDRLPQNPRPATNVPPRLF